MTVLLEACINRKCHFSNKLIKQYDIIGLYSKYENCYFEKFIYKIFNFLPSEIVDQIIIFIEYKIKIGLFGLRQYTIWKPLNNYDKFKIKILKSNSIIQ